MSESALAEAIEDAAKELPPGYTILIAIERHSGVIHLRDPRGQTIDSGPVDHEEPWSACINRLVTVAGADGWRDR